MSNLITYYAKTVVNGKLESLQTFDFEPQFGEDSIIQLISKEEYDELYKNRDKKMVRVIPTPRFTCIGERMIFKNTILENSYSISDIPYDTIDFILYANDIYINGVIDFSTNLFNGFIAINGIDDSLIVDSCNSISFNVNEIQYNISISEKNINVSISMESSPSDAFVIDVKGFYSRRYE